jgi:phosphatidylglycerol:prolipoprotein diacylglycerol transferase
MIPYLAIEFLKIGPFTFYVWGFFIALAFLVGLVWAIWQGRKIGIDDKKIIYLVIFIFLGAMFGARLLYVLQWPADFFSDPLMFFRIGEGGMMFYGGLLGGLLAGWLYIRKWENRWKFISALTPVFPLAMAVGRIACFLSNDHLGALTNLPWGIRWPSGSLRHPVALYLILFNLALAGFLFWYRRKTKLPGQVFFAFLILYGVVRFLLDFTRDFSADPHYWGLAVSQWISIAVAIIALKYLSRPTVDKVVLK